jgi:propanol-preferring alcohol dehydrogenase
MAAMVLEQAGGPLRARERDLRQPRRGELLIKVKACAVCRTDLHVIDGDLPGISHPLIPGHEIVGEVLAAGDGACWQAGARVGVPWLGWTCGKCDHCLAGRENLCDRARFTGYQIDGGFATHLIADHRYCFAIDDSYDDAHAAPLLCAGLIGFRSLVMAGEAERLGIYGFGAAAHIVAQVARHQGRQVFAFTRHGDRQAQEFAKRLGAAWAGASGDTPPEELDAAIIFAPVGELVPMALRAVRKGGTVVCGGIHMSDIPAFPYRILWGERVLRSVANLTRRDAEEFLALAPKVPVATEVQKFALSEANTAVGRLRAGALNGAAVLVMQH